MSEAEKSAELISKIMTWMREPDYVERASVEWVIDWVNRRPLASIGLLACLTTPPVTQESGDAT